MPFSSKVKGLYCDMYTMVNSKRPPEREVTEDEVYSLCDEFDGMMLKLARGLDEVEKVKGTTDRLEAELDLKQSTYLECEKRYDEYLERVRQPYEQLKKDIDRAQSECNQAINRRVSLEEKYHNRAHLVDLNRLKESLEEQQSKIDKDIEEAKIKIHDYQHLNPDLLDEYKSLKNELEMHSLLEQINTSSASAELTVSTADSSK